MKKITSDRFMNKIMQKTQVVWLQVTRPENEAWQAEEAKRSVAGEPGGKNQMVVKNMTLETGRDLPHMICLHNLERELEIL